MGAPSFHTILTWINWGAESLWCGVLQWWSDAAAIEWCFQAIQPTGEACDAQVGAASVPTFSGQVHTAAPRHQATEEHPKCDVSSGSCPSICRQGRQFLAASCRKCNLWHRAKQCVNTAKHCHKRRGLDVQAKRMRTECSHVYSVRRGCGATVLYCFEFVRPCSCACRELTVGGALPTWVRD